MRGTIEWAGVQCKQCLSVTWEVTLPYLLQIIIINRKHDGQESQIDREARLLSPSTLLYLDLLREELEYLRPLFLARCLERDLLEPLLSLDLRPRLRDLEESELELEELKD